MQRILFCVPPAQFAVLEMSQGYLAALRAMGHDVHVYDMAERLAYHRRAANHEREAWFHASETILQAALYHRADVVIFVCGLSFHPIAVELLARAGVQSVALYSESPFQDVQQLAWAAHDPKLIVYTNDAGSAARHGWRHLPLAYDPAVHKLTAPDDAEACDVLFVGTGYPYRQIFLEAVDWTGIDVRLCGVWDGLTEASPLWPYYRPGIVPNGQLPARYAAAKIGLNIHLAHPDAQSLNQRAFELAACRVFQLTDRSNGSPFSRVIPTFTTPADLSEKLRYYLAHADERAALAELAHQLVEPETYGARAEAMMAELTPRFATA